MGKTFSNGRVLGQEPTCLCATTGLCSSLVWHPQQCSNLLPSFILFSACHPSLSLEYISPPRRISLSLKKLAMHFCSSCSARGCLSSPFGSISHPLPSSTSLVPAARYSSRSLATTSVEPSRSLSYFGCYDQLFLSSFGGFNQPVVPIL